MTTESDQVYHNTLKGVPKHIRNSLNLEAYNECLYSNARISKDIFNFRFYNTDMSLTRNSKIILSSFEDKRYYIDGLTSYGYSYHKINDNIGGGLNNGCQSPPEGREKRKRNPDENVDILQKKKKIGMIYCIIRKKAMFYSLFYI